MQTRKILGLDLGTNSIGWAVVNDNEESKSIASAGSRIIPMDAAQMGDFESGNSVSQTANRTAARGARRLYERRALRRERLNRVLSILGFLPPHYAKELNRYGQLNKGAEPKLAWSTENGKSVFLFQPSFVEMTREFAIAQPQLVANGKKIAYDWTIYYLRKKALTQPVTKHELAWILLQFNQKRGYNQARGEEDETKANEKKELKTLKVVEVRDTGEVSKGRIWYEVVLENGDIYKRQSAYPLDWVGKVKDFIVTTKLNEDGSEATYKDGKVKRSFSAPQEDDWGLRKIKTEYDIAQSGKTVGEFIYDALLHNPEQKILGQLVRVVDRKFYKEELRRILETQKQFIPELQDADLYQQCIEALYPQNEAYRNSIANKDFTYLLLQDIIFYQRPLRSKKSLINECPYEFHIYKDKNGEWRRRYLKCISKSHPLYEEFRLWQFVENLHIYKTAENGVSKSDCTAEYIPNKAELVKWLLTQKEVTEQSLLKCIVDKELKGLYLSWNNRKGKKFSAIKSFSSLEDSCFLKLVEDLHIYQVVDNVDCTEQYIHNKMEIREWLLRTDENKITQDALLTYIVTCRLSWNYVSDKKYPMAPVTATISSVLEEAGGKVSAEALVHIWHILYSVSDKEQLSQALSHYAEAHHLSSLFVEKLGKQKPFAAEYGAYSEKAIRKLLSLMRCGDYWNEESINDKTKERIEHLLILTGEVDDNISDRVREKLKEMNHISDFQGLPLWLAEYVVYDVRKNDTKWETPEDIDNYLQSFRLHSLNNPIVEQVVMESLRTVRDIWKQEGHIDEIHIEMGRELKQNAEQRKNTLARQTDNEKANLRAKLLLQEFMNPEANIEGVRAYSPSQLELFRIYEDGVLNNPKSEKDDDIQRIIKELSELKQPSAADVRKYRLWLDQKYTSPYTGQPIPLTKLFTSAYQIEHVIPQSRFFDDSMSNKVICEAEVNARKDRLLAHEFISKCGGEKITLSGGKVVTILMKDAYEELVRDIYKTNPHKQEKLMLDDIPEKFTSRQMNDSRYISRLMLGLLSNIVRKKNTKGEYEPEASSKNVIVCNGATTTRLKKDWGINDVWNHIILPRFERLNQLQNTTIFTTKTANGHTIPALPLELSKNFEKKRIDHRHHAMDAMVIAFTTRNHVNLLSNEAALEADKEARYDLQMKLHKHEIWTTADGKKHTKFTDFIAPYEGFQEDVRTTLENIIVSFKQNLRVINKSNNHNIRFVDGKKNSVKQEKGDNWAIRKSLHKATVFGKVNLQFKKTATLKYALEHLNDIVDTDLRRKLRELIAQGYDEKQIKKYFSTEKDIWADINLQKIEVYYYTNDTPYNYYATRTALGDWLDEKSIREKVTDTGIQKILLAHLAQYNGDAKEAFSADGIEKMNQNIVALNGGVPHKPIYKVRKYEKADKFAVGEIGSKAKKYVEADKGTNLFFAIYVMKDNDGKEVRSYATIPLKVIIDCQKQGKQEWKLLLDQWVHENNIVPANATLKYILSPGDLVYLPKETTTTIDKTRIYKMVSSSGPQCFFIPDAMASPIINNVEFSPLNKMERALTGEMIKEICVPIHIDRLGNIISLES